jgi:hypothetical protein
MLRYIATSDAFSPDTNESRAMALREIAGGLAAVLAGAVMVEAMADGAAAIGSMRHDAVAPSRSFPAAGRATIARFLRRRYIEREVQNIGRRAASVARIFGKAGRMS